MYKEDLYMRNKNYISKLLVVLLLLACASIFFVACDQSGASANITLVEATEVTASEVVYTVPDGTLKFSSFDKTNRSVLQKVEVNVDGEGFVLESTYTFNEAFSKILVSDVKIGGLPVILDEDEREIVLVDGFLVKTNPVNGSIIKIDLNPVINNLK